MVLVEFGKDSWQVRKGWTVIASDLSNDLLQAGHFLIRLESLSSTHPRQNICPHVRRTVFLKSFLQIEHVAILWYNS
jgi:hypothetical protein